MKKSKPKTEPRMMAQYAAICIKADGKDTDRKLHRKQAGAEDEARATIVKLAQLQKTGTFAIVKIVGIVEPVSPTIASRKPAAKDDRKAKVEVGVHGDVGGARTGERMLIWPAVMDDRVRGMFARQAGKTLALATMYGSRNWPDSAPRVKAAPLAKSKKAVMAKLRRKAKAGK